MRRLDSHVALSATRSGKSTSAQTRHRFRFRSSINTRTRLLVATTRARDAFACPKSSRFAS